MSINSLPQNILITLIIVLNLIIRTENLYSQDKGPQESHSLIFQEPFTDDRLDYRNVLINDRGFPLSEREQLLVNLNSLYDHYKHRESLSQIENRNFSRYIKATQVATSKNNFPIYRFDLRGPVRGNDSIKKSVLIVSGTHAGTEPHSVEVTYRLLQDFIQNRKKYTNLNLTIYPLLNPWGFLQGHREDEEGYDLNRTFNDSIKHRTMNDFANSFSSDAFSLALDLHGAYRRHNFFSIRAQNDFGLARAAMSIFPQELLLSSIDNQYPNFAYHGLYPYRYCLYSQGLSESSTPGTIKSFLAKKVKFAYTLEYPGQLEASKIRDNYSKLIYSFLDQIKDDEFNNKLLMEINGSEVGEENCRLPQEDH